MFENESYIYSQQKMNIKTVYQLKLEITPRQLQTMTSSFLKMADLSKKEVSYSVLPLL